MNKYSISLTAEEREMVLNQLSARKDYFREEQINETDNPDQSRFRNISKLFVTLDSVWTKILNAERQVD